jgi:hypothetical protein
MFSILTIWINYVYGCFYLIFKYLKHFHAFQTEPISELMIN